MVPLRVDALGMDRLRDRRMAEFDMPAQDDLRGGLAVFLGEPFTTSSGTPARFASRPPQAGLGFETRTLLGLSKSGVLFLGQSHVS